MAAARIPKPCMRPRGTASHSQREMGTDAQSARGEKDPLLKFCLFWRPIGALNWMKTVRTSCSQRALPKIIRRRHSGAEVAVEFTVKEFTVKAFPNFPFSKETTKR